MIDLEAERAAHRKRMTPERRKALARTYTGYGRTQGDDGPPPDVQDYVRLHEDRIQAKADPTPEQYMAAMRFTVKERQVARLAANVIWETHMGRLHSDDERHHHDGATALTSLVTGSRGRKHPGTIEQALPDASLGRQCQVANAAVLICRDRGLDLNVRKRNRDAA